MMLASGQVFVMGAESRRKPALWCSSIKLYEELRTPKQARSKLEIIIGVIECIIIFVMIILVLCSQRWKLEGVLKDLIVGGVVTAARSARLVCDLCGDETLARIRR